MKSTQDLVELLRQVQQHLGMQSHVAQISIQFWANKTYRILDIQGNVLIDSDELENLEDINDVGYLNAEFLAAQLSAQITSITTD